MPSFPLVMHSWLSELFIAIIYKFSGFYGLSFIFSFFCLGPLMFLFYFLGKNINKDFLKTSLYWRIAILIFSITVFFGFFYIRPQVFSWGLWALFVLIISRAKLYLRFRFFLPLLFLIWSNLHGDFALPVFLLVFLNGYWVLKLKKIDLLNILILALSWIATLINPFGVNLWREVFATYFNPYIRANITEWKFITGYFDLSFVFLVLFTTLMVWRYRKRFELYLVLIYLFLLVQAITSVKNVPLFVIYSFIFNYKSIYLF